MPFIKVAKTPYSTFKPAKNPLSPKINFKPLTKQPPAFVNPRTIESVRRASQAKIIK